MSQKKIGCRPTPLGGQASTSIPLSLQTSPTRAWRYSYHCICFLLLVALHLFFSRGVVIPTAMYDEFVYLSFGQYFSGVAPMPNLEGAAFGAFGYGLLIAPAFWMADAFPGQFRMVLILNAFLTSTAYFPLYSLGRTVFGLRFRASVAAAAACCVYPSYLLFSSFALSDNAFVPFFLFMLTAASWLVRKPGWWPAVIFGLSTGSLYAIHSRSLGAIAAAALFLLFLAVRRILRLGPSTAAMLVIAGTIIVVRYFTKHLLQIGWAGTGEVTISATLQQVFGPGVVESLVSCLIGHVWYLTVCTLGIAVLGALYLLWTVSTDRDNIEPSTRILLGYTLISVVFVSAVSLLFISGYGRTDIRPDFIATGRYWEGVTPVLMLSGFAALRFRPRAFQPWAIPVTLGIFALSTVLVLPRLQNLQWLQGPAARINIFALMGWLRMWPPANFLLIALMSASCFIFILVLSRRLFTVAALLTCGIFITVTLSEWKGDVLSTQQGIGVRAAAVFPSTLIPLMDKLPAGTRIEYDMARWVPYLYANYQLNSPRIKVEQFNSKHDFATERIVVSGTDWLYAGNGSYVKVGCETVADNCLYAKAAENERLIGGETFLDRELGSRAVAGVNTEGLYGEEGDETFRYRWTNGKATITVPLPRNAQSPQYLVVALRIPDNYKVSVLVNNQTLANERVSPGTWIKRLSLPKESVAGKTRISIQSDTFVPAPGARTLGVQLVSLKLQSK